MNTPSCRAITRFVMILVMVANVFAAYADGRKVALVIGNGNYRSATVSKLVNPPNDARDMSASLASIGFEVITVVDATREEIGLSITRFGEALSGAEVGLFYCAGHGVQVNGANYLIPVDADLPNSNVVPFRTIPADEVLAFMDASGAALNLFLLDACRDNPLPQVSRTLSRGLAAVSRRPPETMIVYATAADQVASYGSGRNSPFTAALLKHLPTPGLDVYDLYRNVSADVQAATGGAQRPEQFGNVTVRYSLVPGSAPRVAALSPGAASRPTLQVERGSVRISVATAGTVFLDGVELGALGAGQIATIPDVDTGSRAVEIRYANGKSETQRVTVAANRTAEVSFAGFGSVRVSAVTAGTVYLDGERLGEVRAGDTSTAAFTYVQATAASRPLRDEILVEGGVFTMGSPSGGNDDERPVRQVTLDSFFMMRTEVAVAQFRQFVDVSGYRTTAETSGGGYVYSEGSWHPKADASWRNPYFQQTDRHPVVLVSWCDAVAYANWLSSRDGLTPAYTVTGTNVIWNRSANGLRLPTEAEWEYAARGGRSSRNTTYAGSDDFGSVAWYDRNSGSKTQPVAGKQANELGLYDLSGNVWEWCWDWYGAYPNRAETNPGGPASGTYRVHRGGSWNLNATNTRVAFRGLHDAPGNRYSSNGFRLVRLGSPNR